MKTHVLSTVLVLTGAIAVSGCASDVYGPDPYADYPRGSVLPYPSPLPYGKYGLRVKDPVDNQEYANCVGSDPLPIRKFLRVPPSMPDRAEQSGWVVVGYDVVQGQLENVTSVAASQGFFERAALRAVEQWRLKTPDNYKDCRTIINFRLTK